MTAVSRGPPRRAWCHHNAGSDPAAAGQSALQSSARTRSNTAETRVGPRGVEQRGLPRMARSEDGRASTACCAHGAEDPRALRHPACAGWRSHLRLALSQHQASVSTVANGRPRFDGGFDGRFGQISRRRCRGLPVDQIDDTVLLRFARTHPVVTVDVVRDPVY